MNEELSNEVALEVLNTASATPNEDQNMTHMAKYIALKKRKYELELSQEQAQTNLDKYYGGSASNAVESMKQVYSTKPLGNVKKTLQPKPESNWAKDTAKDIGLETLNLSINTAQAFFGLLDIAATYNPASAPFITKKIMYEFGVESPLPTQQLKKIGINFDNARKFYNELQSQETKNAIESVAQASGVFNKIGTAIQNPEVIRKGLIESVGPMLFGGAIGRSVKLGKVVQSGIGEALTSAGMQTSEIAGNQSGDLTDKQKALVATSGLSTALISMASGRLQDELGLADIDSVIVSKGGLSSKQMRKAYAVPLGAFFEGFAEELPQGTIETITSNLASERPWNEGLEDSQALGILTGVTLGAGSNAFSSMLKVKSTDGEDTTDVGVEKQLDPSKQYSDLTINDQPVPVEGQDDLVPTFEIDKDESPAKNEIIKRPEMSPVLFDKVYTPEEFAIIGEKIPSNEKLDEMFFPNEQLELFKKAIRGDKAAQAMFNQNNVGVEEEITDGETVQPKNELTVLRKREDLTPEDSEMLDIINAQTGLQSDTIVEPEEEPLNEQEQGIIKYEQERDAEQFSDNLREFEAGTTLVDSLRERFGVALDPMETKKIINDIKTSKTPINGQQIIDKVNDGYSLTPTDMTVLMVETKRLVGALDILNESREAMAPASYDAKWNEITGKLEPLVNIVPKKMSEAAQIMNAQGQLNKQLGYTDLSQATIQFTKTIGRQPSPEEFAELKRITSEAKAAEDEVSNHVNNQLLLEEKHLNEDIAEMAKDIKLKSEKKKDDIPTLEQKLKTMLGEEFSGIFTAKQARAVQQLFKEYIHDKQASTVKELRDLFKERIGIKVSDHELNMAFGGKRKETKGEPDALWASLERKYKVAKKQAKLEAEVKRAFEFIFDKLEKNEEITNDDIEKLHTQFSLLSASTRYQELSMDRKIKLAGMYEEVINQIKTTSRKIRPATQTPDKVEAQLKENLSQALTARGLQDQFSEIWNQLVTGEFKTKLPKQTTDTELVKFWKEKVRVAKEQRQKLIDDALAPQRAIDAEQKIYDDVMSDLEAILQQTEAGQRNPEVIKKELSERIRRAKQSRTEAKGEQSLTFDIYDLVEQLATGEFASKWSAKREKSDKEVELAEIKANLKSQIKAKIDEALKPQRDAELAKKAYDIAVEQLESLVDQYENKHREIKQDKPKKEIDKNLKSIKDQIALFKKRIILYDNIADVDDKIRQMREAKTEEEREKIAKELSKKIPDTDEAVPEDIEIARMKLKTSRRELDALLRQYSPRSKIAKLTDILGASKNIVMTLDDSVMLVHLLPLISRHPLVWSKTWITSLRALMSKDFAEAANNFIEQHKNYTVAVKAGYVMNDALGQDPINRDEPLYMKTNKVIGKVLDPFNRSISTAVNVARFSIFNEQLEKGNYKTEAERRGLMKSINVMTGRGWAPNDADLNQYLSVIYNSVRLMSANFEHHFLIVSQAKNPAVRNYIMKAHAKDIIAIAGLISLWVLANGDDSVDMDPDSPEFLTFKYKNVRINPFGRLAFIPKILIRSANSIGEDAGLWGDGESRFNIREDVENFFTYRNSPWISSLYSLLDGRDWRGKKVKRELDGKDVGRIEAGLTPFVNLTLKNAYEIAKNRKLNPLEKVVQMIYSWHGGQSYKKEFELLPE